MAYYILYNPLSGNGNCKTESEKLISLYEGDINHEDITKIEDVPAFFADKTEKDTVVICGGDGTINKLVNFIDVENIKCELLYYACGTGNDFLHDIGKAPNDPPFDIKPYLKNLPYVVVNGKKYRFINNVGFGIDGYCCEVGDKLKAESTKPVNYTAIAIKGLLGGFKPTGATITVDGTEYRYEKVWVAPTMKGRYYGGGMMATPEQDRLAPDGTLSVMLFYGKGKLPTLMVFPKIFKGQHVKYKKMVVIHTGKNIHVKFDSPRAVQIDGETIVGVTEYSAYTDTRVTENA